MLSRYTHHLQIAEDVWAVFNSLVMAPVFVNRCELESVLREDVDPDEHSELQRRGIFVESPRRDVDALRSLTESYERQQGSLSTLYILPSTSCNLRCRYCFVDNNEGNQSPLTLMSAETAIVALDKFYEFSVSRASTSRDVIFYGGEPLLNPEVILAVLNHANSRDMECNFSVITNATLLTPELIEALGRTGIRIGLSVDGPPEIHDANRLDLVGSGTYDRVARAVSWLQEADIPFSFSITISEEMLDHTHEMVEWIRDTGVKSINFNLLHFEPGVTEARWTAYYNAASEFLIRAFEELRDLGFYESRIERKTDSFVRQSFRFCDCAAASASQITVKPNGDVCICHAYAKNDADDIGSILTDSIPELLARENVDKWRRMSTIYNRDCLCCEAIALCGGGCPLQAQTLFGSMDMVDLPFCIHTKRSLVWLLTKLYVVEAFGVDEGGVDNEVL